MPAMLAVIGLFLSAPVDRTWLDRLDPAAIPTAERFPWQPPELVGVLGTHRGRHWGSAVAAAVSPDGKVIASGGSENVVRLWDARDLTQPAVLEGHRSSVARVVFSPDGKLLATACDEGTVGGPVDLTVRLWRIAGKDSKPWATLPPHASRVVALAFLDDGKSLGVVSEDGAVRVWNVEGKEPAERTSFTLRAQKPGQQGAFLVLTAAFTPDGKTLVTRIGLFTGSVEVWDVATGNHRATLAEEAGFELTLDGRSVRVIRSDGVTEWDLTKVKPVARAGSRDGPTTTASRDGTVFVRTTEDKVEVLRRDGEKERVIARLAGVRVAPGGLSADGKTLAGATGSRVRVWDVGDDGLRERVLDNSPTKFVFAAAFNPTSDRLYAVHSGPTMGEEVFLTWELKGAQPVPVSVPREEPRGWAKVVFGPGGSVAAVDSRPGGAVFDVITGKVKSVMPKPPKDPYSEGIHALAFSPDGRRVATAVSASRFEGQKIVLDWHTIVWDVSTPTAKAVRELPVGPYVTALAFGGEGKALAVGHQNGSLALWDITADAPRLVKAWHPHVREVSAVAISPDGQEVASGSTWGVVRRGKVGEEGTAIVTETSPIARTDQLAFTPDGKQLLAMFNTGRFVAADVAGKLVIDLRPGGYLGFPSGALRGFGLAADGRHVAVPTINGLVYVLRLRP